MLKIIAGLVAGLIVALAAIYVVQAIGNAIYPLPAEANLWSYEGAEALIGGMPLGAQAFVVGAWFASAFVGGLTAAQISRTLWPAWVIVALVAFASILNIVMIPHPEWMQIAAVVAPVMGGLIAVHRAKRNRRDPFGTDRVADA